MLGCGRVCEVAGVLCKVVGGCRINLYGSIGLCVVL